MSQCETCVNVFRNVKSKLEVRVWLDGEGGGGGSLTSDKCSHAHVDRKRNIIFLKILSSSWCSEICCLVFLR